MVGTKIYKKSPWDMIPGTPVLTFPDQDSNLE